MQGEEGEMGGQGEEQVWGPLQAAGEQHTVEDPHRDLRDKSHSEEQEEGPALGLEDNVRRVTAEREGEGAERQRSKGNRLRPKHRPTAHTEHPHRHHHG